MTAGPATALAIVTSWLLACGSLAAAQDTDGAVPDAATAAARGAASRELADYVGRPDGQFAWHVRGRYSYRGSELVELVLTSQSWRGTAWKHQLILIKPPRVRDAGRGVLIVGGGRWRDSYETDPAADSLPEGGRLFVAIARRLQTVVAVLGQVPFQPLFERNEDELIAYTFDQYLRTGDSDWPLLLPMVKSAVRAMDATSQAAEAEWDLALSQFTLLGGSKRGWTTWLTAAVDARVTALAPVVIDALNMKEHFPYQTRTWGAPSEEIRPYTDLDLPAILASDEGAALRRIVDPYEYRAAITQPKLIVLATNDRYFPVDSANLYFDALDGPKYLLYLPNDEHSISDYRRLIPSLRALHASAGSGAPFASPEWEYRWSAEGVELCVAVKPSPSRFRRWQATSATRDFRDAVWSVADRSAKRATYRAAVEAPRQGYVATFVEAVFGRARGAYSVSTNLAILGGGPEDDVEPRPRGRPGVCGVY